ncbi:olfactory receptor 5G9-like [Liasis olivaceus]
MIYILTMAGNLLIVVLVVTDEQLHTPMYFFLGNLSFLEICYSSNIIPRMLVSFLTGNHHISVNGCILQLWIFGFLIAAECYLLTVMSYDRYVAICRPLHYTFFINTKVCLQLVAGSFFSGFIMSMIMLTFILQLTFCDHSVIDHFFCDFIPVVNVARSNAYQIKIISFILTSICTLPPFGITIVSYAFIINAILRISSTRGRRKAFSTCSSHLIVVTIFYGTIAIVYLLSDTSELQELNKVFSVFYTILTPLVNPLIYSLRNKEVKEVLKKAVVKYGRSRNIH